jgi:hypothetical protein
LIPYSSSKDAVSIETTFDGFKHTWNKKYRLRQAFMSYICCVGLSDVGNPISFLNQGQTTTAVHHRLVADFLGIPLGKEWQRIQHCKMIFNRDP